MEIVFAREGYATLCGALVIIIIVKECVSLFQMSVVVNILMTICCNRFLCVATDKEVLEKKREEFEQKWDEPPQVP